MAANSTDISVCARMSELPRLMRALAEGMRQLGIAEDIGLRVQLIVEELFTNTVNHGHGGDDETSVSCRIARQPSGILLRYTDAAPAYDMTLSPEPTASETMIGGLGITLIRGLSQDMRYTRQNDLNICEIRV